MNQQTLLRQLTAETLACRKCRTDSSTFHCGKSVLGDWAPPRGWAGRPTSRVDIVIAALNPGKPMPGELDEYGRMGIESRPPVGEVSDEQLKAVCDFGLEQFARPKTGRDWVFHRKATALAHVLLSLIDGGDVSREAIWSRVWFTDVFKCSTVKESGPRITGRAEEACRPHLQRELQLLQPRLVVSLGVRASDALARAGIEHAAFRHPSRGCPRWDSEVHDPKFEAVAAQLKVKLPSSFRELRRKAQEQAFLR